MRIVGAVALALWIAAACATPAREPGTTSQALASPAPPQLLTRIPITARLGRDGVRPSPNGELVQVVTAPAVPATPPTDVAIVDLRGRELAAVRGTEIHGTAWLSDSSGLLLARRTGDSDVPRFDADVLGVDGSLRTVARGVSFPTDRDVPVGPGGRLLFTRCCPNEILAVGSDGSGATTVARGESVRVLGWDATGRTLYADLETAELVTAETDGRVVARTSLRPPAGVRLVEAHATQSQDRRATLVGFRADRAFEGGGQNGYGLRLFVDGALRDPFPGLRLDLAIGPHDVVGSTPAGPVRYDLVTGATAPLHVEPAAISGSLMYASASVNPSPRIRIARLGDAAWRELDLPFDHQSALPRPLARSFLIFDSSGALWSLDGEVALAQSSTTLPDCRNTYPDPADQRKPIPAATADQVRAGIEWDSAFRHMIEDVAGTRQDSNPLRDPAVPRCRIDLLQVGQPVFVARTSGGTWLVPVAYQGRTIVTARIAAIDGKGTFVGTQGGPAISMAEADARRIGGLPNDAIVRARLVYAFAGRGPNDQIAWELTRSSGAIVYLFPSYPGAGPDGRLFDARDVQLVK